MTDVPPPDRAGDGCAVCLPYDAEPRLVQLAERPEDVSLLLQCPACGTLWESEPLARTRRRLSLQEARERSPGAI